MKRQFPGQRPVFGMAQLKKPELMEICDDHELEELQITAVLEARILQLEKKMKKLEQIVASVPQKPKRPSYIS